MWVAVEVSGVLSKLHGKRSDSSIEDWITPSQIGTEEDQDLLDITNSSPYHPKATKPNHNRSNVEYLSDVSFDVSPVGGTRILNVLGREQFPT